MDSLLQDIVCLFSFMQWPDCSTSLKFDRDSLEECLGHFSKRVELWLNRIFHNCVIKKLKGDSIYFHLQLFWYCPKLLKRPHFESKIISFGKCDSGRWDRNAIISILWPFYLLSDISESLFIVSAFFSIFKYFVISYSLRYREKRR